LNTIRKIGSLAKIGLAMLILLFWPGVGCTAQADSPAIAVLYPDVREPYQGVFLRIIGGIEEGLKTPVKRYAVAETDKLAGLESELEKEHIRAVIALGRAGLAAAERLREKLPVVVGAVSNSPGTSAPAFPGITLSPDPDVLFDWLKQLAPEVRRVTVIYNQEHGEKAMDRAREAARTHGLTLNALPAENLRSAANLYRSFLSGVSEGSEALWLPQDESILDENSLLPVILKEAWDKNLVVFSSTPEYVKKGALFSLYPDNAGMGRSLAALALQQLQETRPRSSNMAPLRDLLIAVNLRTAEHLGLRFPIHEMHRFDLVFPTP
jgi:putative ABC transport system substrate-binding protein